MNPERELQFKDQVDQFDHEMFQEEYREELASKPKPRINFIIEDEDELMELERELDCE